MSHCLILKSRDAVVLLARSWPELASFLCSQILRIMTYLTTYKNSLVSKLEAVNQAKSPVSLFLMPKTFEQRRSVRRSLASQPRFPPRTGKIRLACEAITVYLTSPEPSKNCYNLFTLHPIKKTLTPLESSQLSHSGDILH